MQPDADTALDEPPVAELIAGVGLRPGYAGRNDAQFPSEAAACARVDAAGPKLLAHLWSASARGNRADVSVFAWKLDRCVSWRLRRPEWSGYGRMLHRLVNL